MIPAESYEPFQPEQPAPLVCDPEPGAPYPIDALPPVLADGVRGVTAHTQCPDALAAGSVLSAAAFASMPHVDVERLDGSPGPISLFLVTIAASGERKSSADSLAVAAIVERERDLHQAHAADAQDHLVRLTAWDEAEKKILKAAKGDQDRIVRELGALGPKPEPPPSPVLLCGEPTIEGLWHLLATGQGYAGLFSAEGGAFFGGHAMSKEARLRSAAQLSEMWDGAPLRRVRRGDGASVLYGRRLCLHLMAQPGAAGAFLADPVLRDQGLLSRILLARPPSNIGARLYRAPSREGIDALARYRAMQQRTLARPIPRRTDDPQACAPRLLRLSPGARSELVSFADAVERECGPSGRFRSIAGPAAKLAEQAVRLAGVFTALEDADATSIQTEAMMRAVRLALWHGEEALRLFDAGTSSPEAVRADRLRQWLVDQPSAEVSRREMQRNGPGCVRDSKELDSALAKLEESGWLFRIDPKRSTWRVWRP